jgi:membrane protein
MTTRSHRVFHRVVALLRGTWNRYIDEHGDLLAAAVAFYSLLSLAPLSVIAISVASVVVNRKEVREEWVRGVSQAANADVAHVLVRQLDAAEHSSGRVAAVIALLTLLWAASRLFVELQEALNVIWGVRTVSAQSALESIRRNAGKRLAAFAMVFGSGALLLALLGLQTLMSGVSAEVKRYIHVEALADAFGFAGEALISLALLTLLCALIYRVLPDARTRWRDVLVGGAITALLVLCGTALFGLYLGRIAPAWLQGALGSVALFMIWTYYVAQVFLIGAAFTRTWACRSGVPIEPAPHAELRPEPQAHSTRQSSAQQSP